MEEFQNRGTKPGTMFAVTVPEGVCGGQPMQVQTPDGQMVQTLVPDGLKAGDAFQMALPAVAQATVTELVVHTTQPPVLCTGFEGSVACSAPHLFDLAEDSDEAKGCLAGAPLLTDEDESTKVPGVFLVGPTVSHGELSFCFIYKFRQRFGVVADAIARGLGRETGGAVEAARDMNMFMDDFECCKAACGEAC